MAASTGFELVLSDNLTGKKKCYSSVFDKPGCLGRQLNFSPVKKINNYKIWNTDEVKKTKEKYP